MAGDFEMLDDGTEGANVGYRSFQGSTETSDDEGSSVDNFDEGEDDFVEEGEEGQGDDEGEDEGQDFDEEQLSPAAKKAVAAAVKRVERSYEKKLAAIRPQGDFVELAGALQEDPKGTITTLARKYGITLADESSDDDDIGELSPPGQDESLDAYIKRAVAHGIKLDRAAQKKASGKGKPPSGADIDQDLQNRKMKAQIAQRIAYLDAVYDDWKTYTDEMSTLLKGDPTLRDNLDRLYTLAKAAKQKKASGSGGNEGKGKGKGRRVASGERGSGRVPLKSRKGKMSFNEAWEESKRQLSRRT